jgi:tripeptidyl-peptidase-1
VQQLTQDGKTGYIEQYANSADLKAFLTKYRTDISSSTTFTLQTLDGGSNPQTSSQAGVEADLDVQYTIGVATGVPTQFLSVGENFQDGDLEGFLDTVNYVTSESVIPTVMTTSYGQDESTISRALAKCVFSSAQNGSTDPYLHSLQQLVQCLHATRCSRHLHPLCVWRRWCFWLSIADVHEVRPYVPIRMPLVSFTFLPRCSNANVGYSMTSVGATTGISPEKAASFSSGGFSNYFGIPSYQASQVAAYKSSLGTTYSGKVS